MKQIIAALLLLIGSAGAANASSNQHSRYEMWLEACLTSQYSCQGVSVPKVKYESMRKGLYGYYDGGDTVYVNRKVYGLQRRATMYHEMIHYLQTVVGGAIVPGPAKAICKMEAEAFKLTDAWFVRQDRADLQSGANWWRPYRHCHRYYNPGWTVYFDKSGD